jgi:regulatory protein
MRITAIKEQKRGKRVNIYLDERFAFGLSKEALVDFGLCMDKELTQLEIDKILEQDQKIMALQKSFRWLGIRPRSENEIKEKLRGKGFAPSIIEQTIERIRELGYLDDQEFSRLFVEYRKIGQAKGKLAIWRDLMRKGVDKEIIKKSLEEFYSGDEELEAAVKLAKKKISTYHNLPPDKTYQKLSRFLLGRGFNWAVIKNVLSEMKKVRS